MLFCFFKIMAEIKTLDTIKHSETDRNTVLVGKRVTWRPQVHQPCFWDSELPLPSLNEHFLI